MSIRLEGEFSVSESSQHQNVGTSTERVMESENDRIENISNSKTDLMRDAEFIDQLDFDGVSVDSNPPDLDDLDIDLEETNL